MPLLAICSASDIQPGKEGEGGMCVPGSFAASCLFLLPGGRPMASPRTPRSKILGEMMRPFSGVLVAG